MSNRFILRVSFLKNNTHLTLSQVEASKPVLKTWASSHAQSRFKLNHTTTLGSIRPSSSKVLFHLSAGLCRFRNSKKKQLELVKVLTDKFFDSLSTLALGRSIFAVELEVCGQNKLRKSFLNGLESSNRLAIIRFADVTPVAHNGCRLARKRRI